MQLNEKIDLLNHSFTIEARILGDNIDESRCGNALTYSVNFQDQKLFFLGRWNENTHFELCMISAEANMLAAEEANHSDGSDICRLFNDNEAFEFWGHLSVHAEKRSLMLQALMLTFSEDFQDDADFLFFELFSAGMPHAIHFSNGHFHFPVRSGIPLGIPDAPEQPAQGIECVKGDQLFIHSSWEGSEPVTLRQYHENLPTFDHDKLPGGIHICLSMH